MPDETLITEIENLLAEIVSLGGQNEDSKIVPNLTVQDASPTNLDGWLIVSDDRDGDNILARKVGSVIYSDSDLVNVMFLQGGEAIAFQQGSESANNGIWEIVPSTSTDIFYDKGQVGVGTATPGEALDVAGNITLDADIIHRGDTDTKISFTGDDIEFTAGNLSMLKLTETAQDLITLGPGSGDVDIDFNGDMFLQGSDGFFGIGVTAPSTPLEIKRTSVGTVLTMENTAGSSGAEFINLNSKSWEFGVISTDDFAITESGVASQFFVKPGGAVGIGVASPAGKLEIEDGATALSILLKVTADDATPFSAVFGNDSFSTTDTHGLRFWVLTSGISNIDSAGGSATDLVLNASGGDVGITVAAPSTRLDIGAGAMEFDEMTAPAAGAANTARLFAQDSGGGKTQLAVRFNTGAIQILATEP